MRKNEKNQGENKDFLATWITRSSRVMTEKGLGWRMGGLGWRMGLLTMMTIFPTLAQAQVCTTTPDCAALGYNASSCPDGGVKCPWGNKWFCGNKSCESLGFIQTCINTSNGQEGGAGVACNGKYTVCHCANGYIWDTASKMCKFQNGLKNGLYYCNGIVMGVQVGSENLVVMLENLGVFTGTTARYVSSMYSFCGDKKGILPTKDQLLLISKNIYVVHSRLSANGGTNFDSTYYWSSTISQAGGGPSPQSSWIVDPARGYVSTGVEISQERPVRAVLEL